MNEKNDPLFATQEKNFSSRSDSASPDSPTQNPVPVYFVQKPYRIGCLPILSTLSSLLFFLIFLGLFLSLFVQGNTKLTRKPIGEVKSAKQSVAVLKLEEIIMETEGFFNDQIEDAFGDENVKAVVLRIDSPGGSAYTSDFFYNKITKLRKERNIPVVVSMGSLCASGGYYVAMAVGNENQEVIFGEPTTWVGSIGVIIPRYDLSDLAEKVGFSPDPIQSHRLKGMGSMFRPLTEEERGIFQELVNDSFARFKTVVQSGRKLFAEDPEKLEPLATGQIFTMTQALEGGLADKEGSQEDAVARAMKLAGLDAEKTNVFTYKKKDSLRDMLTSEAKNPQQQAFEAISNVASPKAYYLYTQLPGWK